MASDGTLMRKILFSGQIHSVASVPNGSGFYVIREEVLDDSQTQLSLSLITNEFRLEVSISISDIATGTFRAMAVSPGKTQGTKRLAIVMSEGLLLLSDQFTDSPISV